MEENNNYQKDHNSEIIELNKFFGGFVLRDNIDGILVFLDENRDAPVQYFLNWYRDSEMLTLDNYIEINDTNFYLRHHKKIDEFGECLLLRIDIFSKITNEIASSRLFLKSSVFNNINNYNNGNIIVIDKTLADFIKYLENSEIYSDAPFNCLYNSNKGPFEFGFIKNDFCSMFFSQEPSFLISLSHRHFTQLSMNVTEIHYEIHSSCIELVFLEKNGSDNRLDNSKYTFNVYSVATEN